MNYIIHCIIKTIFYVARIAAKLLIKICTAPGFFRFIYTTSTCLKETCLGLDLHQILKAHNLNCGLILIRCTLNRTNNRSLSMVWLWSTKLQVVLKNLSAWTLLLKVTHYMYWHNELPNYLNKKCKLPNNQILLFVA